MRYYLLALAIGLLLGARGSPERAAATGCMDIDNDHDDGGKICDNDPRDYAVDDLKNNSTSAFVCIYGEPVDNVSSIGYGTQCNTIGMGLTVPFVTYAFRDDDEHTTTFRTDTSISGSTGDHCTDDDYPDNAQQHTHTGFGDC